MCQSVEERRTVRDGQGNEETTVTRSGGSGISEGPDHATGPVLPGQLVSGVCSLNCLFTHTQKKKVFIFGFLPGDPHHFSDLRDDDSLFSRFFGGFK